MSQRALLLILFLLSLMSPVLTAGDIKKIRGEAEYFSPKSESPEDAYKNAVLEAQINALGNAFGIAVSERTVAVSDTHDGHTSNSAHSYGESAVNGHWLGDIKKPEVTVKQVDYGTVYYVKVYGEAREMKFNKIDLDCRLLCNGTDPVGNSLRGDTYYEGEELYLYFTSPVDGWLSVYLVDDDDERTTQCLIPYDGQMDAAYPIIANKEYVFFSKLTAEPQYVKYTTRMIVEARKKIDINNLFVIFSPNEFTQAAAGAYRHSVHGTDDQEIQADLMPRETTHKRFDKWLHERRCNDADLQPLQFQFAIKKK